MNAQPLDGHVSPTLCLRLDPIGFWGECSLLEVRRSCVLLVPESLRHRRSCRGRAEAGAGADAGHAGQACEQSRAERCWERGAGWPRRSAAAAAATMQVPPASDSESTSGPELGKVLPAVRKRCLLCPSSPIPILPCSALHSRSLFDLTSPKDLCRS